MGITKENFTSVSSTINLDPVLILHRPLMPPNTHTPFIIKGVFYGSGLDNDRQQVTGTELIECDDTL